MRAAPEQKLWVVVFDGGKALFLENKGFYDAPDLELISRHDNDNPPDRVQTTDKAGRYQDAGSGSKGEGRPADVAHGRSAVQQTDRHELEKRRFVDRMVERLNEEALDGTFDKIILFAADQALGEAREQYHDALKERIVAEEPVDIVNEPIDKLEPRVKKVLEREIDQPSRSHSELSGPS